MKIYEKPAFTVVTLTANSAFCSCQVNMNDIWNKIPGTFSEDCPVDVGTIDITGYCKFLGSSEMVFNS